MPPSPHEGPVVVVALCDHLLASALTRVLARTCRVVATVDCWDQFEDALDRHAPSAVILDLVVGSDSVLPHLRQLTAHYADTRFVVCTPHPDRVLIERVLLAGAAGVLDHDGTAEQVALVIRAVSHGDPWPEDIGTPAVVHSNRAAPLKPLSPRLRQLAELLWQGKSHLDSSRALGLSVKTIEAHVSRLRRAYGVPRGVPAPWERRRRGRKPSPS